MEFKQLNIWKEFVANILTLKITFPFSLDFWYLWQWEGWFRKYWKDLSLCAVDICTRIESYSLLVVVLETEPRTLWLSCVLTITKLYSTVRLGTDTGRRGPKGQRTFVGGMRIRGALRMIWGWWGTHESSEIQGELWRMKWGWGKIKALRCQGPTSIKN